VSARHTARRLRFRPSTADPTFTVVTFDCSCGMRGDQTVGRTRGEAKARAEHICRGHAEGRVETVVARALRGGAR